MSRPAVSIIIALSAWACAPGGPEGLAQTGTAAAVRWTPPAISSPGYEATPTFTPDGRTMYFLAADAAFSKFQVARSRCIEGRWSAREPAPFSVPLPVFDADPFVTPDGRWLYYISSRHNPEAEDFDIWRVRRRPDGGWSTPERLPEPVNSSGAELLPRVDRNGRLYFGSDRPGGHGKGDIYVAEESAEGRWTVNNVGPPVSSEHFEYEAEISRDGSTLVVVADRGVRSHLYRYVLTGRGWEEVGQIPAKQEHFQVGPLLSPTGDRLLFAQRDGADSGEMFVIDLEPDADHSWPPSCR